MLKGFTHARLACGCRIAFREGVEGSPVTVVVDEKGTCCVISLHVRDLPLYDYREALRPPTRSLPLEEEEEEGGGGLGELHPQLSDERQVVRRHQREPRPRQLELHHFDIPLVIDVIQVQDREDPGIGATAPEVGAQVDAFQAFGQHFGRHAAHPFVEVAEHDFRDADAAVVEDRAEPAGLVAPFEERRAEVDVIEVQRVVADVDIDALAAARLARPPGQVVLRMLPDRQAAQHHVAEERPAEVPRRGHHPSHAEHRAELLGVARRRRAGADHLLQGDDVGVDARG